MEMNRREFLVLAAATAVVQVVPIASAAPTKLPPADPYVFDELPISGLAGECSGHYVD
ncbi:MAG: hypothetical protein ACAI25_02175 [Planctomycetota bacterium]